MVVSWKRFDLVQNVDTRIPGSFVSLRDSQMGYVWQVINGNLPL